MADPTTTYTPPPPTPDTITTAKGKWLASVPDILPPELGRDLADAALADARAVVLSVADRYHGTVPPPPWPATPALIAARKRVQISRDGFDVMVRSGAKGNIKILPAVVARLRRDGAALYDAAAELVKTADTAPTLKDALKKLPDPRSLILGLPMWVVAVGAYFLDRRASGRGRALI